MNNDMLGIGLCCCFLLVFEASASSIRMILSPILNVSIDHFISDLSHTVTAVQQRSDYRSYSWIHKSYLLTDLSNIPSHRAPRGIQRQPIKICSYNITAAISITLKSIRLKSPNFALSVAYSHDGDPSAVIESIRANQWLTGTQTMHIIHAILPRMGVLEVSLENAARFLYEYKGNCTRIKKKKASISLIELRCIRGKNTDWYADFGYFNGKRAAITWRMRALFNHPVYDTKGNLRNVTLGPFLYDLWNRSDKTEFHEEYRKVQGEFYSLLDMRAKGKWKKTFLQNDTLPNTSAFRFEFVPRKQSVHRRSVRKNI